MQRQTAPLRKQLVLALLLTVPSGGCGNGRGPTELPEAEHMKRFGKLYEEYKQKHRKPPSSTDELREWVKTLPKSETDRLGIEDLDEALTSPRDQQLYVIVPTRGTGRGGRGRPAMQVLVHERTGVDGTRLVLGPRGYTLMEMDEARFRNAVPNVP